MIHRKGEKILNAMEHKVGNLALPQILRWIAGFQVLVWILSLFPGSSMFEMIHFNPLLIFKGEIWRLFSWVFFSPNAGFIFVFCTLFFTFFINDVLEGEWGTFRLNLYVVSTFFLMTVIALTPIGWVTFSIFPFLFFTVMFAAFATLHPNMEILLFGVIPVKAKWLAFADFAILIGMVVKGETIFMIFGILAIVISLIPYLIVFVPSFVQGLSAAQRRSQFAAESAAASGEAFHTCANCEVTDKTHPEREFRVSADGEEYCDECLAKAKEA